MENPMENPPWLVWWFSHENLSLWGCSHWNLHWIQKCPSRRPATWNWPRSDGAYPLPLNMTNLFYPSLRCLADQSDWHMMWASGPDRKRGWSSGPTDRRSPSVPRPLRRGPGTVGGKKSGIASFKSWMSNHENLDVNHRKLEFNHQKWELNSSTMTNWMSTSKIWCQQSEIGFQPPIFASSWDSLLIDGNWNGMLTQAWVSSSKKWI